MVAKETALIFSSLEDVNREAFFATFLLTAFLLRRMTLRIPVLLHASLAFDLAQLELHR